MFFMNPEILSVLQTFENFEGLNFFSFLSECRLVWIQTVYENFKNTNCLTFLQICWFQKKIVESLWRKFIHHLAWLIWSIHFLTKWFPLKISVKNFLTIADENTFYPLLIWFNSNDPKLLYILSDLRKLEFLAAGRSPQQL